MILVLVLLMLAVAFCWLNLPVRNWLIASTLVLLLCLLTGLGSTIITLVIFVLFLATTLVLYFLPDLRKQLVSRHAFDLVQRVLPPMSATEKQAIEAGTVWWDAEIFSGCPDWRVLFDSNAPALSPQEQAFISGPVEQLCEITDDWEITHNLNDLPENVWAFIKENRFFGLNAVQEYGGLGFSALAQSTIIQMLSSRSSTLAATVMVPNSLGPAELIHHYGTEQQKKQYLPLLAAGVEVPCFGLTSPWAGSDADGMPDYGVVCEGRYKGKKATGFRVNWEKRYITLGPVSTLLGLAFKVHDPEQRLGLGEFPGITCALVPTKTKGIDIGERHLPLNSSFQNGPNWGHDVFIPLDWVIGGQDQVGRGWTMLMESLAAGRGISLPAASAGAAKLAARTSGAYARIREQFGIEIGKFEGVQEVLGRIGGLTYLLDSGRLLATSAIDQGHKPSVISAIVKQQCTDLARTIVNDAMDLHGGKAICMGPGNYLARIYQQLPVGITVEGSNILTRSLIIYGQGVMRCHPFLLREIDAVQMQDKADALDQFDKVLTQHVEHIVASKLRCFCYGLTRGRMARGAGKGIVRKYTRTIEHFSAALSYLSDVTLFMLGGELKRKEMLSGRFADVLGNLYLASAALRRFRDNGEPENEEPLLEWACQYALYQAQQALDGILRNYPSRMMGMALRVAVFPAGRYVSMPRDQVTAAVAEILQIPGATRNRLTQDIYIPEHPEEILCQLETALDLVIKTTELRKQLRKNGSHPDPGEDYMHWLDRIEQLGEISLEQRNLLKDTREIVEKVISVDSFGPDTS